MLNVLGDQERENLTEKLLSNVWEACKQKSDSVHREALWRATAMLISSKHFNRQLLHAIAWSQVIIKTHLFRIIIFNNNFRWNSLQLKQCALPLNVGSGWLQHDLI